jgi:hypothetical protein
LLACLLALGTLGYLGCIDAGQPHRDRAASVLNAQGVAIADGEHSGGRLPGERRRWKPCRSR